jgi:hypothetical protein
VTAPSNLAGRADEKESPLEASPPLILKGAGLIGCSCLSKGAGPEPVHGPLRQPYPARTRLD